MLDGAFLSHALLWLIGAMSVCAVVGSLGALTSTFHDSAR
jgi:hypothetical protein